MQDGLPGDFVNAMLSARDGRLWVAVRGGLALMRDGCTAGEPGVQRAYRPDTARNVLALAEGSDGALWVGTTNGILRLPFGGRATFRHLGRSQGLSDRSIFSLAADKVGNIWAGTEGAGAMMIEPAGFSTFREQDGLVSDRVWSVLGDHAGQVLAVAASENQTAWSLNVFDGARFRSMPPPRIFG
jgi:ligand-binding sensor domain-containing protein